MTQVIITNRITVMAEAYIDFTGFSRNFHHISEAATQRCS